MRRLAFVAAAFAVGVSFASAAEADSPWYVSGDFGGYFRMEDSWKTTIFKIADPSVKASGVQTRAYNPGLTGHLALGYRLNPHWRFEAELGEAVYSGSKVFPYTTDPNFPRLNGSAWVSSSGQTLQRFSGALNAYYDFRPWRGVTPYVGAGLGAWAERSATTDYMQSGVPFLSKGGAGVAGFGQVEAGVSLKLAPHWSVVPAYRFVQAFQGAGGDTAHIAKVGVRYTF
jgi:opacity protein-like surface antigen